MNPAQQATNGHAARVLIVDDNADAATTTAMLLEYSGFQVEVVIDGRDCLSSLETFSPDVLLLDIVMPGITGYDLAREIRALPKFERLPIIAISGYADAEHARRSMESGCDQHLVKPVDIRSLNEVIAREVQRSNSALGG